MTDNTKDVAESLSAAMAEDAAIPFMSIGADAVRTVVELNFDNQHRSIAQRLSFAMGISLGLGLHLSNTIDGMGENDMSPEMQNVTREAALGLIRSAIEISSLDPKAMAKLIKAVEDDDV